MSDVDRPEWRETDEWVVPESLRAKGPTSVPRPPVAPQERVQPSPRTGRPLSDLRAAQTLPRDGGEKP